LEVQMRKQAPGKIRDAIIASLRETREPATVQEIQDGVATRLGQVASSSIRSYLRLNADSIFERVDRGLYQLAEERELFELAVATPPAARAGHAQLIQDDCFAWMTRRARNSIEAVVTDPPYGLVEYSPLEQKKLRSGKGGNWRIPPAFDGHKRAPLPRFTTLLPVQLEELSAFFVRWGRTLLPLLVPGANVIVASNPLLSHIVSNSLAAAGLERRGEIIRLVMTMRGGDRPKNAHTEFADVSVMPRSMWEPWLCFRKPIEGRVQDNLRKWKTGGFRRISSSKPFGDVIVSRPTHSIERKLAPHPSLKPQAFLRQVVRAVLPLGQGTILDPFAGAGSTLAAATALGYPSVGIEIDTHYAEIARKAIIPLSKLATG
jgi:site-specific DNA-methyltransferase (adenine-specific)